MKRLSSYLSLCIVYILCSACLDSDAKKTTPEDTNRISSDELFYEIKTSEALTNAQMPKPKSPKEKRAAKLNNSTHQEMLVIYSHLEMSEDQILLFENQFNKEVKDPNPYRRSQIEIQEIMDASFQTVLTEEQFNRYNEWRVE